MKSDPFYSADTNLDLSAYPHLQQALADPEPEEKFAPLDMRGTGLGSSDLKQLLRNPDREAILELRDPELLRKFDEEHGDGVTVLAGGVRFQISHRDGKWKAQGTTPDGTLHRFTASTRDELFPKISRAVSENSVRELTPEQELQVTRLAQSGDEATAFGQYFLARIGPKVTTMDDPFELLSDPKYRSVCDDAAYFIWAARNDNYIPSPKFEEMLGRVAETKPLNARLITSIWIRYLDEKQEKNQQADSPEQAETLEDLDDEAITKTYWNTLKHVARSGR